jgi:hypothetical protein
VTPGWAAARNRYVRRARRAGRPGDRAQTDGRRPRDRSSP